MGVNGIRHGGSEETITAVQHQSSTWVTDRFTESADMPDRPHTEVFQWQVRKQAPKNLQDGGQRKIVRQTSKTMNTSQD